MRIYAFNPEHDLAVANGSENYTPPPLAVRLRNDLSFLPLWLSELPLNEILRSVQTQILPDNIRIFYENMKIVENAEYLPWGWDAYIRKRLINSGARIEDLPSSSYLDLVRKLSHRRTSI